MYTFDAAQKNTSGHFFIPLQSESTGETHNNFHGATCVNVTFKKRTFRYKNAIDKTSNDNIYQTNYGQFKDILRLDNQNRQRKTDRLNNDFKGTQQLWRSLSSQLLIWIDYLKPNLKTCRRIHWTLLQNTSGKCVLKWIFLRIMIHWDAYENQEKLN